jgi:hypothetical protein
VCAERLSLFGALRHFKYRLLVDLSQAAREWLRAHPPQRGSAAATRDGLPLETEAARRRRTEAERACRDAYARGEAQDDAEQAELAEDGSPEWLAEVEAAAAEFYRSHADSDSSYEDDDGDADADSGDDWHDGESSRDIHACVPSSGYEKCPELIPLNQVAPLKPDPGALDTGFSEEATQEISGTIGPPASLSLSQAAPLCSPTNEFAAVPPVVTATVGLVDSGESGDDNDECINLSELVARARQRKADATEPRATTPKPYAKLVDEDKAIPATAGTKRPRSNSDDGGMHLAGSPKLLPESKHKPDQSSAREHRRKQRKHARAATVASRLECIHPRELTWSRTASRRRFLRQHAPFLREALLEASAGERVFASDVDYRGAPSAENGHAPYVAACDEELVTDALPLFPGWDTRVTFKSPNEEDSGDEDDEEDSEETSDSSEEDEGSFAGAHRNRQNAFGRDGEKSMKTLINPNLAPSAGQGGSWWQAFFESADWRELVRDVHARYIGLLETAQRRFTTDSRSGNASRRLTDMATMHASFYDVPYLDSTGSLLRFAEHDLTVGCGHTKGHSMMAAIKSPEVTARTRRSVVVDDCGRLERDSRPASRAVDPAVSSSPSASFATSPSMPTASQAYASSVTSPSLAPRMSSPLASISPPATNMRLPGSIKAPQIVSVDDCVHLHDTDTGEAELSDDDGVKLVRAGSPAALNADRQSKAASATDEEDEDVPIKVLIAAKKAGNK